MKKASFILGIGLSMAFTATSAARIFTDLEGREIDAELVSATDTKVVLKLKKNRKTYTLDIAKFSEEDIEFIEERREELEAAAEEKEILDTMSHGAKKFADFVETNKGKKVGNGECWTLANEGYKSAGIKRPGNHNRIWGRVVDWKTEKFLPGDVLKLKAAKFSNGQKSGPEHTAIIMKQGRRKGQMTVYHQNWGKPGKIVSELDFDLKELQSGEAIVYRYGRR
ncbi:hypothetical protein OAF06_03940 [Akkermansiaceae bacterium]|nr:hypothetical protein [Akkermansiaceae bacterium]MDB4614916.1 hypothetical protein [Akkermansiaceae bacterium]MDB4667909.1 hypothetical protein [Akkermansiaceae bacterium]